MLAFAFGCGDNGTPPSASSNTSANTYLYVGEAYLPIVAPPIAVGYVAQFRVESNGTLKALNPPTAASGVLPFFASVTPSNRYLFIPNGPISEFGVGSNGTLSAQGAPAVTGSSITFTPNGQIALVADPTNDTLSSYTLRTSGALTPINSVPTGSSPRAAVVAGSGKFAYVANSNDDTISEYTISTSGILAPNGSTPTNGFNPSALVVSTKGFLYCANENSGSVTEFSINAFTGALVLVNTYTISVQPQPGPSWISFDPSGSYAYVGNSSEIAQFTVNGTTGALTSNGATSTPNGNLWGGVDPAGRFLFSAGPDGTVSQFIISATGTLIPNGSVFLGANMVPETLAFARR